MTSHPRLLPSDCVRVRTGFGGDEPRGFERHLDSLEPDWKRLQVAHYCFNTFYPEVQGGYFLNRALVAIFQEALASVDVHFCENDHSRSDGVVPLVVPGCLLADEKYAVWHNARSAAAAIAWKYSVGGGGYYSDDFVVTMVGQPDLTLKVKRAASNGIARHARFIDDGHSIS